MEKDLSMEDLYFRREFEMLKEIESERKGKYERLFKGLSFNFKEEYGILKEE